MSDEPKRAINENELPATTRGMWDRAKKALMAKNTEYAVQLLAPIVKENPLFVDGRRALRKSQMALTQGGSKLGKFGAGAASGMSAFKIKPLIAKDPDAALSAIEEALSSDPSSIQLNDLLYDTCMALSMPDVAIFALETLRDTHHKDKSPWMKLGDHYMRQHEGLAARKCYEKVSELDAGDLEARRKVMQASALEAQQKDDWEKGAGKKDDKEAFFQELMSKDVLTPDQSNKLLTEYLLPIYERDQNNLSTVRKVAAVYEKMGDLPSAISYFEWAAHLSKGDSSLGAKVVQLKDKVLDGEFKTMEQDLANNPDAPDAAEKQVRLEEIRLERLAQKIVASKEAVDRNPTDPHLRYVLAEHLYDAGKYTEAIPELQRAKTNPAVRLKTLFMLGRCFARKNMTDLAINQLREAESELNTMDGLKKDVIYERALLHETRSEKEEYLNALKLIYEVDYGFRDVAQRVEASYG